MIPFTQYLMPLGRTMTNKISRPADIEALAQKFIEAGGRYEIEMLSVGLISLTAAAIVNGEDTDVVGPLLCQNNEEVPLAVDELVHKSQAFIV